MTTVFGNFANMWSGHTAGANTGFLVGSPPFLFKDLEQNFKRFYLRIPSSRESNKDGWKVLKLAFTDG